MTYHRGFWLQLSGLRDLVEWVIGTDVLEDFHNLPQGGNRIPAFHFDCNVRGISSVDRTAAL